MYGNLIYVLVFLLHFFQIMFNFNLFKFILFQNPTKMAGRLTLQKRAQIAARYEVWEYIVNGLIVI